MAKAATAHAAGPPPAPAGAAALQEKTVLGRNLRRLIVTIVNGMGLGLNIHVSFRGTRAFTNGRSITLPAIRDMAEIPMSVARALIGYAIHEVAHIRYTDFKQVSRSYALGDLVQKFANAVEDYRIEGILSKAFLGAGPDLTQLRIMIHPPESRMKKRGAWLADPRACGPLALTWTGSLLNGFNIPAVRPTLDMLPPPVRKLVDNWTLRMTGVADTTAVVDLAAQFAAEAEAYAAMTRSSDPQPKATDRPEEKPADEPKPQDEDSDTPPDAKGEASESDADPADQPKQDDGDASEDGESETNGESGPSKDGEDPASLGAAPSESEETGDGDAESPNGSSDDQEAEQQAPGQSDDDGADKEAPGDSQQDADAPQGEAGDGDDETGTTDGEPSGAGSSNDRSDKTDPEGSDAGAESSETEQDGDDQPAPDGETGDLDGDHGEGADEAGPSGTDGPKADPASTSGSPGPKGPGDSVTHDGSLPADGPADAPEDGDASTTGGKGGTTSDGDGQPSDGGQDGAGEPDGDERDPFADALDPNAVIDDIMDDMMRGMARGKPLDDAPPQAEDGEVNPSEVLKKVARANAAAPAYDSSDSDRTPNDDGQEGGDEDSQGAAYTDSRFQPVVISAENALAQLRATAAGAIANTARVVKRLLKSQELRGVHRNRRDGEFDMENTNSIVLGDGQCYRQTWTREAPTTLLGVLGDFSASMMRRLDQPYAFGPEGLIEPRDENGKVLPSPLELAVTGMLALEQATLGTAVQTMLYGYTGSSPHVVLSVFKEGRASRTDTLRKLGSYRSVGVNCTPTGEAIAAVAARMDTIAADRRVLLVLTDGTADNASLCADVARVVQSRGIEIVAIGICHDAVTRWAPVSHVIKDVADLPKALLSTIDPRGMKKRTVAA